MDLRGASVFCLTSSVLLCAACDLSPQPAPSEPIESVSFLDKGAVVPDPVRTLVTIGRDSISFVAYQTGVMIRTWSSSLAPEDFSHLVTIIRENNLTQSPDPVLPRGATGCVGHQGMEIVFTQDEHLETLIISGTLWCSGNRVYWPPGLLSLVTFEETLVNKYEP
jgi:hypothetical protein